MMWRVSFGKSAMLVTAETKEEARLQATAWAWLATGKWITPNSVEQFNQNET